MPQKEKKANHGRTPTSLGSRGCDTCYVTDAPCIRECDVGIKRNECSSNFFNLKVKEKLEKGGDNLWKHKSTAGSRGSGSDGCLLGGDAPGACAKLPDKFAPLIRGLLIMTQIYDTS